MRLWNLRDARIYEGSPEEILRQMQRVEPGVARLSFGDYLAHRRDDAWHHFGVRLAMEGETDAERAASLVEALIAADLVRRIG